MVKSTLLCFLVVILKYLKVQVVQGEITNNEKLNVLLIIVDDLRAETGSYVQNPAAHTPHLNYLANESVQFQRAYAQVPLCGPSRASFLTGLSPDSLAYYQHNVKRSFSDSQEIDAKIIEDSGVLTLQQRLRKLYQYNTKGGGKIFHTPEDHRRILRPENYFETSQDKCPNSKHVSCVGKAEDLEDYKLKEWAIKQIERFSLNPKENWFLTVGIRKPHMPFMVPAKHFSFIEEVYPFLQDIPMATNRYRANESSLSNYYCHVLEKYSDVSGITNLIKPFVPFDEVSAKTMRKGYYAAVSWIDELVGEIIQKLKSEGFWSSTLLLVTSDHGWLLGEHGNWCKNSNFELSARIPLWIRDPRSTETTNHVDDIVSLLDLYPTILELSGALDHEEMPQHLAGKSLAGVFRESFSYVKNNYSFTTSVRCTKIGDEGALKFKKCKLESDISHIGYSVRHDNWRYTEWRAFSLKRNMAEWQGLPIETELYDHRLDDGTEPDKSENSNLAISPNEDVLKVMEALGNVLSLRFNCDSALQSCDFNSVIVPEIQSPGSTTNPSMAPSFESYTNRTISPSVVPSPMLIHTPTLSPLLAHENISLDTNTTHFNHTQPTTQPVALNPSGENQQESRNIDEGIFALLIFCGFLAVVAIGFALYRLTTGAQTKTSVNEGDLNKEKPVERTSSFNLAET